MKRRPPRSTRTDTLFPYKTLFRSPTMARAKAGRANQRVTGGNYLIDFDAARAIDDRRPTYVIAGLDPAIHVRHRARGAMDARSKSAHDNEVRSASTVWSPAAPTPTARRKIRRASWRARSGCAW